MGPTSSSVSGKEANPEGWSREEEGKRAGLLPTPLAFLPRLYHTEFSSSSSSSSTNPPTHCVALAGIELTEICLPLPSKCWD